MTSLNSGLFRTFNGYILTGKKKCDADTFKDAPNFLAFVILSQNIIFLSSLLKRVDRLLQFDRCIRCLVNYIRVLPSLCILYYCIVTY